LRQVVVPVLAAFVFCSAVVLFAAAHPVPRPPRSTSPFRGDIRPFVRYLAFLSIGGYAAFLAIVFVFSSLIVGQKGALRSAAGGGAFLLAIGLPVFVLLSWMFGRRPG